MHSKSACTNCSFIPLLFSFYSFSFLHARDGKSLSNFNDSHSKYNLKIIKKKNKNLVFSIHQHFPSSSCLPHVHGFVKPINQSLACLVMNYWLNLVGPAGIDTQLIYAWWNEYSRLHSLADIHRMHASNASIRRDDVAYILRCESNAAVRAILTVFLTSCLPLIRSTFLLCECLCIWDK